MKLKTLNQLVFLLSKRKTLKQFHQHERDDLILYYNEVREEAIKWVKEDIEEYKYMFRECLKGREIKSPTMNLIGKWMKRLNISEEDLK